MKTSMALATMALLVVGSIPLAAAGHIADLYDRTCRDVDNRIPPTLACRGLPVDDPHVDVVGLLDWAEDQYEEKCHGLSGDPVVLRCQLPLP